MLRRLPTLPVATTCFLCSPPDLNLLVTNFIFCIHSKITTATGWQLISRELLCPAVGSRPTLGYPRATITPLCFRCHGYGFLGIKKNILAGLCVQKSLGNAVPTLVYRECCICRSFLPACLSFKLSLCPQVVATGICLCILYPLPHTVDHITPVLLSWYSYPIRMNIADINQLTTCKVVLWLCLFYFDQIMHKYISQHYVGVNIIYCSLLHVSTPLLSSWGSFQTFVLRSVT